MFNAHIQLMFNDNPSAKHMALQFEPTGSMWHHNVQCLLYSVNHVQYLISDVQILNVQYVCIYLCLYLVMALATALTSATCTHCIACTCYSYQVVPAACGLTIFNI